MSVALKFFYNLSCLVNRVVKYSFIENILDLHIGYLVEWSIIGFKEAYIVNCTFLFASLRIFVLYVKYTFIWFKILLVRTCVVECIVTCKGHRPTLWLSLKPQPAATYPPHHILEVVHKISLALGVRHTEADFAALKWTVLFIMFV